MNKDSLVLWSGDDENIQGNEGIGLTMNETVEFCVIKYELVSSRLLCVSTKI